MIDRLPPYSHDAEAAFLSVCLTEPEAIDYGIEIGLKPGDFHQADHAAAWSVILGLRESKKPVDLVTVRQALADDGRVEYPVSFVGSLAGKGFVHNAEAYAQVVRDKALRRGLIVAAGEISGLGYETGEEIEATFDRAESVLRRLRARVPQSGKDPTPADIIARLEGEKSSGIPTRFPSLNAVSTGMVRTHFWVVGGFSSTGKSVFAINLAEDVVKAGGAVMVASTEMSQETYLLRAISLTSGVPQRVVRHGGMTLEQLGLYNVARDWWRVAPLRVYDNLYNISRIRSRARKVREELGHLDVVIVDFIQNINETGDEIKDARNAAIQLQALAKELDVCVVALSQVSNAMAQQQNESGSFANYYSFKGSGAIRDAADVGIMLDRDRVNKPDVLWVNVVKNRHDTLTRFAARMHLDTGLLTQMTWEEQQDEDPNAGRKSRKRSANEGEQESA